MPEAVLGDLSIKTSTGQILIASSDIGLAWQWAEVEVNAHPDLPAWSALSYGGQCAHVGDALAELQSAYLAASYGAARSGS